MSTTPEGDALRRRLRDAATEAFLAAPGGDGEACPGEPEPVLTPDGMPGYFLIGDRRDNGVVAVARVRLDGRVATVARLAAQAADCAAVVTGLDTARVAALAPEIARRHGGSLAGEPRLVHDGPVGREAWLLVVDVPDKGRRWVFATAGGSYERAVGTAPRGGVV